MKRAFLDSNVLLYADDRDAGSKQEQAAAVIDECVRAGRAVVSTQVLSEYFVIATGKLGVSAHEAQRKVELFAALDLVRVDGRMVIDAIELHRLHSLSYWDALIVTAARTSGCERLVSEDMQDGRSFGDVTVENPFDV